MTDLGGHCCTCVEHCTQLYVISHSRCARCPERVRCFRDVPAMLVPCCMSCSLGASSAPHDERG
eukprot:7658568-Pyramimonas_sp.AAC.1